VFVSDPKRPQVKPNIPLFPGRRNAAAEVVENDASTCIQEYEKNQPVEEARRCLPILEGILKLWRFVDIDFRLCEAQDPMLIDTEFKDDLDLDFDVILHKLHCSMTLKSIYIKEVRLQAKYRSTINILTKIEL
jgi:hypothetical protein